jgi:hypothetical protein
MKLPDEQPESPPLPDDDDRESRIILPPEPWPEPVPEADLPEEEGVGPVDPWPEPPDGE